MMKIITDNSTEVLETDDGWKEFEANYQAEACEVLKPVIQVNHDRFFHLQWK